MSRMQQEINEQKNILEEFETVLNDLSCGGKKEIMEFVDFFLELDRGYDAVYDELFYDFELIHQELLKKVKRKKF